jgi:protein TonB
MIKKRMIMMSKKRTSALSSFKLLFVIPVTVIVFLAISAYRGIPDISLKSISLSKVVAPEVRLIKSIKNSLIPVNKLLASFAFGFTGDDDFEDEDEDEIQPVTDQVQAIQNPVDTQVSELQTEPVNVPEPSFNDIAPVIIAEEMPSFPGGDVALLKFIAKNTQYPTEAKENNIQGQVIVRFCVNTSGKVQQLSILKGVSPELDKEAMRVTQSLPSFKPGRQGGNPVPVWFLVPITFTIK